MPRVSSRIRELQLPNLAREEKIFDPGERTLSASEYSASLGSHKEAADGNCNWFQKEIMAPGAGWCTGHRKSLRSVQALGWA